MAGKPTYEELEKQIAQQTFELKTLNERFIKEIDKRKKVVRALREHDRQYRALVENNNDIICEVNTDGIITYISPRATDVYGYTPEELSGKPLIETMPDDEAEKISKILAEALVNPKPTILLETKHIHKNGHHIIIETSGEPFFNSKGEMIGFRGVVRDITERTQAQESLKLSERKFRSLVKTASDWVWEVDLDARYTYANPKIKDILGYNAEEIIGNSIYDSVAAKDKERLQAFFEKQQEQPEAFAGWRITEIHKDGHPVTLEVNGTPVFDKEGRLSHWQGFNRDITDSLQAEKALRESEEKYRDLVELSPDPLGIIQDGLHQFVNPAFTDLFGYTKDDVEKGLTVLDIVCEEDKEKAAQNYRDRLNSKTEMSKSFNYNIIARDGRKIKCELSGARIQYQGRPAVMATLRDITERIRTEAALRESEEKYRTLVELSPDPVVIIQDGLHQFVNSAFSNLFGYNMEDVEKGLPLMGLVAEDDKEKAIQHHQDRLDGKREMPKSFTYDILARDGRKIKCELSGARIQYQGRPAVMATLRDITERKRMEEALRISEERSSLVMEASRDGLWDWDIKNNFIYASPRCSEIIGVDVFNLTIELWASRLHPDDRASVMRRVADHLEKNKPYDVEFRYHHETGEYIWLSALGIALFDEKGKAYRMVGSVRDITDRKRAEEELTESENRMRQLSDSTWEAILIHDRGILLHANSQFYTMFGYSPEELVGKQLISKMVTPESAELIQSKIDSDSLDVYQITALKKDGTEFPSEVRVKKIDYYGQTVRVVAIRDLTERKEAETALRESEERYRFLFENAGAAIWVFDGNGTCLMINQNAANFYEGIPEDFIGESFYDLQLNEADEYLKRIHDIMESGEGNIFDEIVVLPSGKKVWFLSNSQPVRDADGKIFAVQIISQDISERRIAEEQVRILSQQLIEAQENERQLISRELHDRVAQDLSSAKIGCKLLLGNELITGDVRQGISGISDTLHTTIASVRDLSYDLRPPGLEKLGLVYAISQHCKDFSSKTGVNIDFNSAGMDNVTLGFDTKINLYRVIQEGLNNIWKHANASKAVVKLVSSHPDIILRIEDNGSGFDAEERLVTAVTEKRMGLRSMEERINLLQGTMSIQSRSMKGTKILIEVPIHEKENRGEDRHSDR